MTQQVQITIVGTGCIGTSIGLALRQTTQPILIVGHDKNPDHSAAARRLKAIDKADWNLIGACEDADLIILAIPLSGIRDTFEALAPYLREGCVITDTANLKQQVLADAGELLPESVNFVGGNPVVTSSGSGPEAARADLFEGELYCLTPAIQAHPDAVALVSSLVALLGARPYYLDAEEHDGLIAGAALLPAALALALSSGTMNEKSWREMRKLAGSGFEVVSGLIGDDPEGLRDTLTANPDHVVRWLDTYAQHLEHVRTILAQGKTEELEELCERAVDARKDWLKDRSKRFSEDLPMPEIERPNLLYQILPRSLLRRKR